MTEPSPLPENCPLCRSSDAAPYYAITLWVVIEHVTDPIDLLRQLHARVRARLDVYPHLQMLDAVFEVTRMADYHPIHRAGSALSDTTCPDVSS